MFRETGRERFTETQTVQTKPKQMLRALKGISLLSAADGPRCVTRCLVGLRHMSDDDTMWTPTFEWDNSKHKPFGEPKRWMQHNLDVIEPQPGQEPPPRVRTLPSIDHLFFDRLFAFNQFYCHMRSNIKYSPKKMWFIAGFVSVAHR